MAVRSPSLEDAAWLNHRPLSKKELEGKIVLLDFFTYCCVNCINILPDLKALEEEFEKELIVIGIHSGKHKHEKNEDSIRQALRRYKIEHIVINDGDMKLWDAFGIKAWPTLVLIDAKGYIVSVYQGEGHLQKLQTQIKDLSSSKEERYKSIAEEVSKSLLNFPKKIHLSSEYIFIAHLDEVLVCSYGGDILHKISNLNGPEGMLYLDEKLYICEHDCVKEISKDFTQERVFLNGLRNPYALQTDGVCLYISLAGAHQIKAYDLQSKEELMLIGQENIESLHDGSFTDSVLAQPSGLSLIEDELWFVDSESSSLRCASHNEVHSHIYDSDELQHPLDLVAGQYGDGCGGGRIFICDSYNNSVKVYNPQTKEVITLLENLAEPSGIEKTACELYICNTNKHEIIIFDLSKMQARTLELKDSRLNY